MKKTRSSQKALRCIISVSSLLLALMVGVTAGAVSMQSLICTYIGGDTYRMEDIANATTLQPYTDNGMALQDWKQEADKLVEEIESEGIVLLKNSNAALPLNKGSKVSLFSRSSVDLVLGGTGGGGIKATTIETLRSAMEADGMFTVNPVLWDFYKQYDGVDGYKRSNGGWLGAKPEQIFVAEVPMADYTDAVRASYADYADAAIVVISRVGGEGSDMPTGDFGDGSKYLALQPQEKELLLEIKNSGKFGKVIALINTSNAMELGWVEQEKYGIDACLWIGGVGQSGARAVAKVLCGEVNPSGRLVDTYAADSYSAPAMQNFGDFKYTNKEDALAVIGGNFGTNYVVYQEGIYVGYRYYETRYADSVLNPESNAKSAAGAFASKKWNYTSEVTYPFGYGLSYGAENGLPFEQKIVSAKAGDNGVDVTVQVTNKGDAAGKSVVQLYAQQPYVRGGIEKSAIQLIGFKKTDLLHPGESQTLTIHANQETFASYDYKTEKTYVLDAGDYYFAIGDSAHDALNNVLALCGKTVEDGMDAEGDAQKAYGWSISEKKLLNTSSYTGETITNQFDDADLNYYGEDCIYLTRADWTTFPTTYAELTINAKMLEMLDPMYTYRQVKASAGNVPTYSYGVNNQMTLAKMYGLAFDDAAWDKILNQMTIEDQVRMVSGSALTALPNIAYPAMFMKDGPAGNNVRNYVEDNTPATGFCSEVVFASTYNRELIRRVGEAMSEDWLRTDTEGSYAPAANIHRTPYAGRNFEYFSEDGFLSGEIAYEEVIGLQSRGAISFIKHFALNDQETNRQGLATFSNEQAIREIYLRAFEKPMTVSKGAMCAFNRVGMVWAQAHTGLMTNVVRKEWGSTGIMDTDMAMNTELQKMESGLAAGNNMWATSGSNFYNYLIDHVADDPLTLKNLRNSCHIILYNLANSAGVNGLSPTAHVVHVLPYWQTAAYAVCGVLTAALVLCMVLLAVKSKKEEV